MGFCRLGLYRLVVVDRAWPSTVFLVHLRATVRIRDSRAATRTGNEAAKDVVAT